MGIVDIIKDAIRLARKLDNVAIVKALLDAQQSALELTQQNEELREEVARLKEALELHGTVKYDDGAYWSENGDRDGPFCTKCWEVDGKLVRMKHTEDQWFKCPNCKIGCDIPSGPGATLPATKTKREPVGVKWGCYQFEGDAGLYCTACYDSRGARSRTTRLDSRRRQCPVCHAMIGS